MVEASGSSGSTTADLVAGILVDCLGRRFACGRVCHPAATAFRCWIVLRDLWTDGNGLGAKMAEGDLLPFLSLRFHGALGVVHGKDRFPTSDDGDVDRRASVQ